MCEFFHMHLVPHNLKKIDIDCFKEKGSWNRYKTEIFWGAFVESFFILWNQKMMGKERWSMADSIPPDRWRTGLSISNTRKLHGDWFRAEGSLSSSPRPSVSKVNLPANQHLVWMIFGVSNIVQFFPLPLIDLLLVGNSLLVVWMLKILLKRELLPIN